MAAPRPSGAPQDAQNPGVGSVGGSGGPEPAEGDTALQDSDCELTSYRELATVLENLPLIMREVRRYRRLSMRAVAAEIGISYATISRIERGIDCTLPNAIAVLHWLDRQGDT